MTALLREVPYHTAYGHKHKKCPKPINLGFQLPCIKPARDECGIMWLGWLAEPVFQFEEPVVDVPECMEKPKEVNCNWPNRCEDEDEGVININPCKDKKPCGPCGK